MTSSELLLMKSPSLVNKTCSDKCVCRLVARVSKAGSNLTDIETRRHRDLQDLQGGTTAEYYHLTQAQHDTLTDGSDADGLHTHTNVGITADDLLLTPDDALVTDGDNNALTPF